MKSAVFFLSLLLACSSYAQPCDGIFRDDGATHLRSEYGDFEVKQQTACFPSGTSTVLVDKPQNRPSLTKAEINNILGANGKLINHEVSNSPAVNCHGFSLLVSKIPHLPENAWVDPKDLAILLKEFYTPSLFKYLDRDFEGFTSNAEIQNGDIVLMTNVFKWLNHSGIVKKIVVNGETQNWIVSKLDEGPVVLTPLNNLISHYQIENVLVRRRK